MIKEAVIDPTGMYRYTLYRQWPDWLDDIAGVRVLNFVMLNPSTADALQDDHTIQKCVGFAEHNGYNAIRVVNLFAWRAADPKELAYAGIEPVGPDNDAYIQELPPEETVVAAWGSTHKDKTWFNKRIEKVVQLLNRPLMCLKKTKDGYPWHPLYVPYGPLIKLSD